MLGSEGFLRPSVAGLESARIRLHSQTVVGAAYILDIHFKIIEFMSFKDK